MSSGRIDPDVLNFLRRAHRLLDDSKDPGGAVAGAEAEEEGDEAAVRTEQMRAEVVLTVVEQLNGQELNCARHVFGSVALARVLKAATDAQRSRIVSPLLSQIDPAALLSDKYASHVVEEIIALAARPESAVDPEAGLAHVLVEFAERLATTAPGGTVPLVTSMRDKHATYAVRALFRVLAGRPFAPRGAEPSAKPEQRWSGGGAPSSGPADASAQEAPRASVPAAFTAALALAADAVLSIKGDEGVRQLYSHTVASPALSELLEALPAGSAQLDALIGALLKWPENDRGVSKEAAKDSKGKGKDGKGKDAGKDAGAAGAPAPPWETVEWVSGLAHEPTGSRTLEAVLTASAAVWWGRVYSVFRGQLSTMVGLLTYARYSFTCFCVCKKQSSLYYPPPIRITHTTTILLRDFCAIYAFPPTLPLYTIHHTLLVVTISCKDQWASSIYLSTYLHYLSIYLFVWMAVGENRRGLHGSDRLAHLTLSTGTPSM